MRDKLKLVKEKTAAKERGWPEASPYQSSGRLRRLNVRWPWLKVLLMILLIGGVFWGCMLAIQRNIGIRTSENGQGSEVQDDSTESDAVNEADEAAGAGETKEEASAETEKETEKEAEKETEAASPPEQVQVPLTPTVPQSTGKKLVALTFDDGPSAATTARLLDILAAKQVKATFFVLGTMAQKSPDLIKREVAEGHEVESHTMSHLDLTTLSSVTVQGEVAGVDAILQELIGRPATLVRPPYGSVDETVRAVVGKPMIIWTVDPQDWKYRDAATVRANVVSSTFDGAIVLMHDIHSTTVDAVASIIDDLRAAGYEFLTVSEMAAARGVVLQNGYSYGSFR